MSSKLWLVGVGVKDALELRREIVQDFDPPKYVSRDIEFAMSSIC